MNHRRWKEWIQLSLYNELTDEENRLLQNHLDACEECKNEMEKLRLVQRTVRNFAPPAGDTQLLLEARAQLRRAICSSPLNETLLDRALKKIVRWGTRPGYRIAFAGFASFFVGMLLSSIIFRSPAGITIPQEASSQTAPITGETRIANVRFLTVNDGSGQVDFTFDVVRPVHMKGSIHDGQIQKVLTYAILNEENPGIRLRSIDAVAGQRTVDKEVKNALIAAVKSDNNAGVRKESLRALQNFPLDEDIKKALLFVLNHDKNPGLRITAINLLDSLRISNLIPDKDLLDVFKSTVQTDDNNYIRLRAKAAIEEIRQ
jgi:hypothetical protein